MISQRYRNDIVIVPIGYLHSVANISQWYIVIVSMGYSYSIVVVSECQNIMVSKDLRKNIEKYCIHGITSGKSTTDTTGAQLYQGSYHNGIEHFQLPKNFGV